jgi:hypothetical protein
MPPKSTKQELRRFDIEIVDPATGMVEVDSDWESCTGGGVNIDVSSDATRETTPGHKYIDTLTLRGPLTSGRRALSQWVTEVFAGNDSRRSITVKEILKDGSAGKTYTYHECFPVSWDGPTLDAEVKGHLYDEVHIKPIRMDLA